MLIKGQDIANITFGDTLSADGLNGKVFDYSLSNPPFDVEWKKIEALTRKEFETQGFNGRFGPGLPRVSDGSLLFLLHLIRKMRPARRDRPHPDHDWRADGISRVKPALRKTS